MNLSTQAHLHLSRRRSRKLARLAFLATLVPAVFHVALGADPLVVFLAFLTVLIGVYAIARPGILNIGAVLVFLVTFRYVGFPMIAKLFMGQPLDSNLYDPLGSFLVVLLGSLAYLVAFEVARKTPVGRPLLKPVVDSRRLRLISIAAAAVGVSANVIMASQLGTLYTGITVANYFVSFLHLSLIAAVAGALLASKGRRSWDLWVIAVIVIELAFALTRNSRMVMMETFLSYLVTVIVFRGWINWRQGAALALSLLLMVVFITPVMLEVRGVRSTQSATERIENSLDKMLNWREAAEDYQNSRKFSSSYLYYYGASRNVFERMSFISHVDLMKVSFDAVGFVGFEDIETAFARNVPRLFSPDKQRGFSKGDWLYCKAQLGCRFGGYLIAPLIANAYAALGWAGVILYPLLLGFPLLLVIKKIAGLSLYGNIWALYLILRVHNSFVEGSSDAYVGQIFRQLPQDLIVMLVLAFGVGASVFVLRKRDRVPRPHGN